jgi:phage-related baseplate assembly protein
VLNNLPAISILTDEGITFDGILNDMIADYEARYKELTGEELTLYPADSRRIMLNTVAGKLYQLAVIMDERHRLNFLQYMYGDFLRNWCSNFGFTDTGVESAATVLRFSLAEVCDFNVVVPAGTRATSGDGVYFVVDEDCVIAAGDLYADTSATCSVSGVAGNGYAVGQVNTIVDPVNLVVSVENVSLSDGGHDEYTDQELRELVYNCQNKFTTAGSEDSYCEFAKQYSSNIVDAKAVSNLNAEVFIYILLQNGRVPDEAYCDKVCEYIKGLKVSPDTDKVSVVAPGTVGYDIEAVYYIAEDNREIADGIKEAVAGAVDEFADYVQCSIGRAVNPNLLVAYANAAGASRIEIVSPVYTAVGDLEVAVCGDIKLSFGGFDKG